MRVGGGGKKSSAWTSGLKKRLLGKAILQNKASQHPVCPTRPEGRDSHFVVADVGVQRAGMCRLAWGRGTWGCGGRGWAGVLGFVASARRGPLRLGITWSSSARGRGVEWVGIGLVGFKWMTSQNGRISSRKGVRFVSVTGWRISLPGWIRSCVEWVEWGHGGWLVWRVFLPGFSSLV